MFHNSQQPIPIVTMFTSSGRCIHHFTSTVPLTRLIQKLTKLSVRQDLCYDGKLVKIYTLTEGYNMMLKTSELQKKSIDLVSHNRLVFKYFYFFPAADTLGYLGRLKNNSTKFIDTLSMFKDIYSRQKIVLFHSSTGTINQKAVWCT